MRKSLIALAAATGLAFGAVSVLTAQVFPPSVPPPAAPSTRPEIAAPTHAAPAPSSDDRAVATLRRLLEGRGFGAGVVDGPMAALAPGEASALDFAGENDLDAPLGPVQAEAWLVQTTAGRWWLWDYGACAPADRRGAADQDLAIGRARTAGRMIGDS